MTMNSKPKPAPSHDTAPSNITDHAYINKAGQPWGLCAHGNCNLAEAAHRNSATPFKPNPPSYRCPNCVTKNIEVCAHQDFQLD